MKKKTLSKSEIKELNEKLSPLGFAFDVKEQVELVEDEATVVSCQGKPFFFQIEGQWIPSLKLILEGKIKLKQIVVDMGAVKFVCNGADIMRPGIREIEDSVVEGTLVQVIDEKNRKPLAVGKALLSSELMRAQAKGKSIQNIHYVGDKFWGLG
ncbi:MAG: DUF1947 domain-containing protein [Nanoarchaeota archaeon]|nr:DUF1947 domain-containing protein [Nanoarchaeota archaeon]